ncbi:hypothetical protein D9M68_738640 [compost metagenome]
MKEHIHILCQCSEGNIAGIYILAGKDHNFSISRQRSSGRFNQATTTVCIDDRIIKCCHLTRCGCIFNKAVKGIICCCPGDVYIIIVADSCRTYLEGKQLIISLIVGGTGIYINT